jgi:hypothetical protein
LPATQRISTMARPLGFDVDKLAAEAFALGVRQI